MKNVVIYLRVSSEQQVRGYSLQHQREICEANAKQHKKNILKVFTEEGESARDFGRTEWVKMLRFLKQMKKEKIGVAEILVARLDRFSRDVAGAMQMIARLHKEFGVTVVSALEDYGIDPDDPIAFKLLATSFVDAEFEVRRLSFRTKSGNRTAALSGHHINRPPYGYVAARTEQGKRTLQIVPNEAQVVRFIFDSFLNEVPISLIAKAARAQGLHRKGHGWVNRMLENETYVGRVKVPAFGKNPATVVKAIHEAIVREEVFVAAKDKLSGKLDQVHEKLNPETPLRGIVRCEKCKNVLTSGRCKGKTKSYFYYTCNVCTKGDKQWIRADYAHSWLKDILEAMSFQSEDTVLYLKFLQQAFDKKMKESREIRDRLVIEIEGLKREINALTKSYVGKMIDKVAYESVLIEYRDTLAKKEQELSNIDFDDMDICRIFEQSIPKLSSIATIYEKAQIDDKRVLLSLFFGRNLTLSKAGYRTRQLHPIFEHNLLKTNKLYVDKNMLLVVENNENQICSDKKRLIELFEFLNKHAI